MCVCVCVAPPWPDHSTWIQTPAGLCRKGVPSFTAFGGHLAYHMHKSGIYLWVETSFINECLHYEQTILLGLGCDN